MDVNGVKFVPKSLRLEEKQKTLKEIKKVQDQVFGKVNRICNVVYVDLDSTSVYIVSILRTEDDSDPVIKEEYELLCKKII